MAWLPAPIKQMKGHSIAVEFQMDEVAALIGQMVTLEPHVSVGGPAPITAILELEAVFGHPMPPSCWAFLTRFGGLTIHANCVSGVTDGLIDGEMGRAWCDTQFAREQWGLPAELLVIEPDTEEPACLDFSQRGPDGKCPVGPVPELSGIGLCH